MKKGMQAKSKWTGIEVALLIGLAVFLTTGTAAIQTQEQLADKVVRLHVLANSDSEKDQALKLHVRDAVLEQAASILEQSADRRDAERVLQENLPELENVAQQEIYARGYAYSVTAELTQTTFPTKEYEGFSLPAGEYLALRVMIGEARGQNWWCVVFPPLCTTAAMEVPISVLAAGFSDDEVRLITEEPGYLMKFKVVEFWEILRDKWNSNHV